MIPLVILIIPIQAGWQVPELEEYSLIFHVRNTMMHFERLRPPQQGAFPFTKASSTHRARTLFGAGCSQQHLHVTVSHRRLLQQEEESHREGELGILQQSCQQTTAPLPLLCTLHLTSACGEQLHPRIHTRSFYLTEAHTYSRECGFYRVFKQMVFSLPKWCHLECSDLRNHTEIPHFIIKNNVRDWHYSLDNLGKG